MINKEDFKKAVKDYTEEDCNSPFRVKYLYSISKMFKGMSEDETVDFIKNNINELTAKQLNSFSSAIEDIYFIYQTHPFSQKLNKAIGYIDNEYIQKQLEYIELISMPDDEA